MASWSSLISAFVVSRTTGLHPFIDLFSLELPKPADPVRGHVSFTYPRIDSVPTHPKVLGDFLHR
jgi:hypothetical protein